MLDILECFQVIPILKLLYSAEEQNSHHIYMALIVLLILSQDENFNKSVHEVVRNKKTVQSRQFVL